MDVATGAPQGGEPTTFVPQPPRDFQSSGEMSDVAALARSLADQRYKARAEATRQDEQPPEPPAQAEPPAQESATADAHPPEEAQGEPTEATEQAQEPPIDPPRFWTKDAKERFASLPRDTQQYIVEREQGRDTEVRRLQNESAERNKALEAKLAEADKVRSEYEAKLPALLESIHQASPFADIKSMADVEKMQAEDPFRFQQFQLYQWKMQAVAQDAQQAEQRKAEKARTDWEAHVQEESNKFTDAVSEADKPKLKELIDAAPDFLRDKGFSQQELTDLSSGKSKLSIFDHRVQSLIHDGMKYRDLQKAKSQIVQKPLPPAQRPGTGKVDTGPAAQIQALQKQLDNATGMEATRIAARITQLRRAR